MAQGRIPESLRRFVDRQTTLPVTDLWDGDRQGRHSPYGSYWYRAVACILLSGRVQARRDGAPNMTDVNRVGKEANFNQYLTERIGRLLVAMGAVQVDRQGRYAAGPDLAAFWDHDVVRLPTITRQAVLQIVQRHTVLGLEEVPPAPDLATVFKALPDLSVFAGAGVARETLVPLFRYGTIRRIDQVYEFRLDRKRLAESPSTRAPSEELRAALRPLEPLPATIADLLATRSRVGGKLGIRWCSALVKPESAEVLAAIREHPKLKGYGGSRPAASVNGPSVRPLGLYQTTCGAWPVPD